MRIRDLAGKDDARGKGEAHVRRGDAPWARAAAALCSARSSTIARRAASSSSAVIVLCWYRYLRHSSCRCGARQRARGEQRRQPRATQAEWAGEWLTFARFAS